MTPISASSPWRVGVSGGQEYLVDPDIEQGLTDNPLQPGDNWVPAPAYPGDPNSGGYTYPQAPAAPAAPAAPGAAPGAPGGRGSINVRGPGIDYSGILQRYAADWNARLNAGLAANEAQRLSRARSAINRLGLRNSPEALAQLSRYGLTAADLQQAQDNPFSDLRAIQQQAERQRGQGTAEFAARGGFRSGGTAQMLEDVENARARNEASATQETLGGLDQDLFQAADWERQQRDEITRNMMGLETNLAQIYQPVTGEAQWDAANQGYRLGNQIYDQWGNPIRTV